MLSRPRFPAFMAIEVAIHTNTNTQSKRFIMRTCRFKCQETHGDVNSIKIVWYLKTYSLIFKRYYLKPEFRALPWVSFYSMVSASLTSWIFLFLISRFAKLLKRIFQFFFSFKWFVSKFTFFLDSMCIWCVLCHPGEPRDKILSGWLLHAQSLKLSAAITKQR